MYHSPNTPKDTRKPNKGKLLCFSTSFTKRSVLFKLRGITWKGLTKGKVDRQEILHNRNKKAHDIYTYKSKTKNYEPCVPHQTNWGDLDKINNFGWVIHHVSMSA